MTFVKKNSLFKVAMLLVMTAFILGAAQLSPGIGVAAAGDLDIYLNGALLDSYTYAELENGFPQHQITYSTINTYGTNKDYVAKGPALDAVLAGAGMPATAQTLKFTATDGLAMTFTVDELIRDLRYSNYENGAVPTILALLSASGTNPASMTAGDRIRLMLGHRTSKEQNNVWQIKLVNRIDISTTDPGQWALPTASPVPGTVPSGTEVSLHHPIADLTGGANIGVKIYYTLDGSTPTINSTLYNISAWQPELNLPIKLTGSGTKTIKAIVIGPGYKNSGVATFNYTVQ